MTNNAGELFQQGYNCAQAVVCAHCEKLGVDKDTALKFASSFGGGMGRLREVCGAVSGMFMVLGLKDGYTNPEDNTAKKELYEKVQALAKKYEEEFGSIVCRELLGLDEKRSVATPEKRTETYYKKRPCKEMVQFAADLIEKELFNVKENV